MTSPTNHTSASALGRAFGSIDVLRAGFVAAGFMLTVTVLLALWQHGDDQRLLHSLAVEVAVGDVLSALQDSEIGQRGYLLTNDPAFLKPFRKASERLARQLAKLGQAVAGQPEQTRLFTELSALSAEAQTILKDTLSAHERGDLQGALDPVKARSGKALMDEIRLRVDAMDAEEDRLVEQRLARLRTIRLLAIAATAGLISLMGVLAHAALREARRRAALARFLPSEIAPLLADGATALSKGSSQTVAVAFVDLRDSTALAETLPPVEFMAILAAFRRHITRAARGTSGVIDKFIGDGALVVFGLTGERDAAAANALRFAEELLTLTHPKADCAQGAGPCSTFGIGVHFGTVFCGVVGDDDRLEFTVLGDAVNVASRLQAQTRKEGVSLIVSGSVLHAARQHPAEWRRLVGDTLPGRDGPVPMFVREPANPALPWAHAELTRSDETAKSLQCRRPS